MSIFEPNIEQITISEQVAVIPDERWSLVSQMKTFLLRNLCILNHQYYIEASGKRTSLEPLQVKHAVTQISLIRHFGLRQIKLTANILKQSLRLNSFHQPRYVQSIRLNSFHQPRYVSNIIQPNVCMLRMFKAHCKVLIGAQIFSIWIDHFGSCQFLPTSNFVSATRICHSKLQLFCASCAGLVDWTFSGYRANWTWQ